MRLGFPSVPDGAALLISLSAVVWGKTSHEQETGWSRNIPVYLLLSWLPGQTDTCCLTKDFSSCPSTSVWCGRHSRLGV